MKNLLLLILLATVVGETAFAIDKSYNPIRGGVIGTETYSYQVPRPSPELLPPPKPTICYQYSYVDYPEDCGNGIPVYDNNTQKFLCLQRPL